MDLSFGEAMATAPMHIQIWTKVLAVFMFGTPVYLLFVKSTRRIAFIILCSSILNMIGLVSLYSLLDYVRLLSLPHILIWVPLLVYLFGQLKTHPMPTHARYVIIPFCIVVSLCLVIDFINVGRYILGDVGVLHR